MLDCQIQFVEDVTFEPQSYDVTDIRLLRAADGELDGRFEAKVIHPYTGGDWATSGTYARDDAEPHPVVDADPYDRPILFPWDTFHIEFGVTNTIPEASLDGAFAWRNTTAGGTPVDATWTLAFPNDWLGANSVNAVLDANWDGFAGATLEVFATAPLVDLSGNSLPNWSAAIPVVTGPLLPSADLAANFADIVGWGEVTVDESTCAPESCVRISAPSSCGPSAGVAFRLAVPAGMKSLIIPVRGGGTMRARLVTPSGQVRLDSGESDELWFSLDVAIPAETDEIAVEVYRNPDCVGNGMPSAYVFFVGTPTFQ